MKKFAALFAVVVAVIFSAGLVISADAPEKITLDKLKKEKPAVTFNHKGHGEKVKACKECHHKDEKGKEQKCSTADCHGAKADGKKVELKEAFHKRCKGCHQKEKKGPTKCEECHKKA